MLKQSNQHSIYCNLFKLTSAKPKWISTSYMERLVTNVGGNVAKIHSTLS